MPAPTSGFVLSEQDRAATKAWVEQNPLRRWRHSHQPKRLSILEAAQVIGVGMSMVQMYERGVHKPTGPKAERFAQLLGSDWNERWDAWLANQPDDPNTQERETP